MPIVRIFQCSDCFNRVELTLSAEQWDDLPPVCPICDAKNVNVLAKPMQQEFRPIALGGSPSARAHAIAEDIAGNDYHVADMQPEHRMEGTPKVRYKDASPAQASTWGAATEAIRTAMVYGKDTRLKYGSGLDILQANIKSGKEPDLIELSKKRSIRIY